MPSYKVPLREFRYVLHEVLGVRSHYRTLGRDDINAIQAESRNGVLKVRVPKTPAPKPRTIEVQVN